MSFGKKDALLSLAMACPVCHSEEVTLFEPASIIKADVRERREFVLSRLGRRASKAELKDLTDFMHGFAAPLERCAGCGLIVRAEYKMRDAGSYSEDPNDPGVMKQLLPRYVRAFRNKAAGFKDILRPGAEVLEVGSHLGAFLQVAEEWNWNPTGLDVGEDTAAFAEARGLRVKRAMIEDAQPPAGTCDAVFIWNCFEQLADPAPALRAIHTALRRHGLLILRVPNALFYQAMRRNRQALAWNNMLGFPYLYGYTPGLLQTLARQWGFEYLNGFDSELITLPFPDLTAAIHQEQEAISRRTARWSVATTARTGVLTGPWIEAIFRKIDPSGTDQTPHQTKRRVDLRFLPRAA